MTTWEREVESQKKKEPQIPRRYAFTSGAKGQLNSEWIYEFMVSPKMQTFNKLPGQKAFKFLVGILGETMISSIHSEFNWPLGQKSSQNLIGFFGQFGATKNIFWN